MTTIHGHFFVVAKFNMLSKIRMPMHQATCTFKSKIGNAPRLFKASKILLFCALSFISISSNATDDIAALELQLLASKIDQRIANMKMLANTIANDAHIQRWVADDFPASSESILVDKLGYLVEEYGLTSASFADTKSHKYWNHEGFLRELTPEIDTWYYAYLKSGKQDLISVYHDKNKKRVDLYVNYRQSKGNGLSGIATSFDGVVDMLEKSSLAQSGSVYIVDSKGVVQVHPNPEVAGQTNITELVSIEKSERLLTKSTLNLIENKGRQVTVMSSFIPSMGWFIVAELATN
jgi:methyl-accepting chemotaxis protein